MIKILMSLLMTSFLMSPLAHAEWDVNIPLVGDNLTDFPIDNQANLDALELLLLEYPKGMTLSYSSGATIVVSTGGIVCADSGGTTKRLRANTSTTNVTFADLDTGVEASNTTYYVYATCDAVATTAAFKISASSSSPSGITYYKRIGSFLNDSSSNITLIDNDRLTNDLGARTSKTIGVIYQATTSGEACGTITGSTCAYLTGLTDNSSSPSAVGGYAGVNSNAQADHTVTASGFCMPVKAGDYYEVTATKNDAACTSGTQAMYFVPYQ